MRGEREETNDYDTSVLGKYISCTASKYIFIVYWWYLSSPMVFICRLQGQTVTSGDGVALKTIENKGQGGGQGILTSH